MNGKIMTFFEDKGFGFITDENGENHYFHVIKVQNPEMIKKNAAVTFEPTNNAKGPSAFAVKVLASSKYITIANERIKISSIKSFNTFTKAVPMKAEVDKENTVLSVGLLMNRIRPQSVDILVISSTHRLQLWTVRCLWTLRLYRMALSIMPRLEMTFNRMTSSRGGKAGVSVKPLDLKCTLGVTDTGFH
ncbi:'Cold-shock' DNA-binding domain-containing protein [Serratia symbiotica SCt-VLC]|uniref:'Cold-shock' DNA-binding domain-containing protein n=1 Tax=Serratia symbiotica SCt-VLC TaxID=1347341 RepID=A0A068RAU1_9GAMM|nr:cold shock domain-containing protein [Serratia symbiotica]CDG47977.1 'Cold-shock' DNA-binding domain-containing protein [Serratia symbiotica SCt-VLC]